MVANVIAVKLIAVGPWILPAGVIIFPLSYILGDVLTEVYGYGRARQVIWLGFACNLLAVLAIALAQALPPAGFWDGQAAFERILGYTPRLLLASFLAYLIGEFVNAYVLARMKILTRAAGCGRAPSARLWWGSCWIRGVHHHRVRRGAAAAGIAGRHCGAMADQIGL